jgi:hypothetical protein
LATTSEAMGAIGVTGRRSALAVDWRAPDRRRILQLVLATIWLLDAVLQFQPYMFTKAFGSQMIAGMAVNNPAGLAHQITWAGRAIGHHAMVSNATFGLIQLFIALGIAWRPTVKLALTASVVWALGVWWIGEGLGGVLTRTENPLTGAPGAVILYALLAVLLWPTARQPAAAFVAARPLGATPARALWLVLWGSMTYYALLAVNRSSQGLHEVLRLVAVGQPHWLSTLDNQLATLAAHRGLETSIVLAAVFAVVAVGVFLPLPWPRITITVAVAVSIVIWVVGEAFGDVFSGAGTDPSTGPLLILLAAAFWPRRVPDPGVSAPASAATAVVASPSPAMSGS